MGCHPRHASFSCGFLACKRDRIVETPPEKKLESNLTFSSGFLVSFSRALSLSLSLSRVLLQNFSLIASLKKSTINTRQFVASIWRTNPCNTLRNRTLQPKPIVREAMAAAFQLPGLQGPPILQKSHFLGQTQLFNASYKSTVTTLKQPSTSGLNPTAKFNLYEIMGGRGLCNGEEGLEKELKKTVLEEASPVTTNNQEKQVVESTGPNFPEDGFEKELLGLTGGFPGGEKGLQKFIEQNPPPPPTKKSSQGKETVEGFNGSLVRKPKPPELPLLLPGMIAIVKNPNSPYHMYCGIVQRITDGKAGVLFEGGNWDRLISFRLDELERREKGPPMVNPKSVILEEMKE